MLLPSARWLLRWMHRWVCQWMLPASLCLPMCRAVAQQTASVPTELQFAGVSVFLTAPTQQRVQQEMARLYADRTALRTAIEQMRSIDSVLEPMLEEQGIPSDFRYACLPFQPNGGYWGLDAADAPQLRLRVDNAVDERLNLSSASAATLAELAALFPKRTNWVHALVSFLQGQRPAVAADPPATSGSATKNTQQLGLDSPDAIWTVLARKIVYEREAPLIRPVDQYLLFEYRQGRGKSLSAIADELRIDQTRFVPFNEWLKDRLIPTDKVYPVLIRLTPTEYVTVKGLVSAAAQSASSAPQTIRREMGFPMVRRLPLETGNDPLTRASAIFYEINGRRGIQAQACDNLITLSYYGRLPVDRFIEINDLSERDLVRAGELYYLELKDRRAKVPFHVVQPGQTLRDVSNMYGVRLRSLLRFNDIEPNQRVQAGRIIWMQQKRPKRQPVEYQKMPERLPETEPTLTQRTATKEESESVTDVPAPEWRVISPDSTQLTTAMRMGVPSTPSPEARPETVSAPPANRPSDVATVKGGLLVHTVKAGDTHASLAQRYNLRLSELITWNNLSYRKPLVVGAQLVVGKPGTLPPAAVNRAPAKPVSPAATNADVGTAPNNASASVPATASAPRPVGPYVANSTRPAPGMKKTRGDEDLIIDVVPIFPATKGSTIRVHSQGVVNKVQIEQPKVGGNAYYHVVKPGQTVYRVALINKVTVADVMKWNNLRNFSIEIGQRLLIKK